MKWWMPTVAAAALALSAAAAAAQTADPPLPPLVISGAAAAPPPDLPLTVRHARPPHEIFAPEELEAQTRAARTIPLWSDRVDSDGRSFRYVMVGRNPQMRLAEAKTVVDTVVVPVRFRFAGGAVFDPAAPDPVCSPAGSALDLLMASPVFQDTDLQVGEFFIGTGQYPGLFQRGNFYQYTAPGTLNPDFKFVLNPIVHPAVEVIVPGRAVQPAPCGKIGFVDLATFDREVQARIFPALRSVLRPTRFVLFLFYNVVLYEGSIFQCCTLGYHSAFRNPAHRGGFQTYAVADFDSSGKFLGVTDVEIVTHEIGEWEDDPRADNRVPSWGHLGQVPGCAADLEVGDPLTGTTFPIKMANGFTYHLQDLAFFWWFYRQVPSLGVDGLYSVFGSFTSPSQPCR